MNSLDKFRSRVGAKQTELILRKLVDKQQKGEIRTDDDLRLELAKMLGDVTSAGFLTLELPAQPWDKVESERFKSFFDSLGMDIETLFTEVDHTEEVLQGLGQNTDTQLRDLRFALGNLKSEVIARRLRRTPGSGWSTILRDSFDSGYSKLLGRAELDIDLFFDARTGFSQSHESIPIKSDARIEGVAKKLTLPEIGVTEIGFKRAVVSEETPSNLPIDNKIDPYKIIDGMADTFWSHTVGTRYPILGDVEAEVTQIAGTELPSGNELYIDTAALKDPQSHESYVRVVGFSGLLPQYVCLATPEDYSGPGCKWDLGHRCQFNYEAQYSQNCANKNCARYSPTVLTISGLQGPLEDGYRYETGGLVKVNNLSGIHAGQTFRVLVQPSGANGAQITLALDLTKPTLINWVEIDPVVTSPFTLVSVEYKKQGDVTLFPITGSPVQVLDKIRLDFRPVEASTVYLTLRQETYERADLHLQPSQQAIQKIDEFITRGNAPSIEEFYDVELESLLVDYLPNGPMRKAVEKLSVKPQTIKGHFYTFGLFEVNCGLTSYADTAVAVAKEVRVITPRMFGIQSNLEADIDFAAVDQGINGTVEYSVVKFNYDKNNALINVDDFPLPIVDDQGLIVERLFLDTEKTGLLRFAAKSITAVVLVNENRDLDLTEYVSSTVNTPLVKTEIVISTPGVTEDSIILVAYKPTYGVFLNEGRTISIEDNSTQKLSLSEVPAVVVTAAKTANRSIKFADVNLRIILRRNSLNIYDSPGLRDYQFLISESDEGRFF